MAESSGSSSSFCSSKRTAVCWEKVLNSESNSKGKSKYRVSCKFCGEGLAYHGATTAMNEHLKRKHPVDAQADQPKPKQMKLESFTSRKVCTKERTDHINLLVIAQLVD